MRFTPFFLTAFTLAAPAMTMAQTPSTQPAEPASAEQVPGEQAPADQPSAMPQGGWGGEDRRMRGGGGGRWGGGFRREWFSEEEWASAAEFMQLNFPQRWELYKTIEKTDRNRLIMQVKLAILNRYRQLLRMERDNIVLYEAAMKHAKAEEDAYAAAKVAQESPNDTQAQSNLRTQVERLVEQTFSERKSRLMVLRATLDQQEKQLEEDRKNIEPMVKTQIDRLTSDNPFRGPDATMNPNGPRPDGPREGPRGEGSRMREGQ